MKFQEELFTYFSILLLGRNPLMDNQTNTHEEKVKTSVFWRKLSSRAVLELVKSHSHLAREREPAVSMKYFSKFLAPELKTLIQNAKIWSGLLHYGVFILPVLNMFTQLLTVGEWGNVQKWGFLYAEIIWNTFLVIRFLCWSELFKKLNLK